MLDVYRNAKDKLILWRLRDRISASEMITAAWAFTVGCENPAYDHVTIVDARDAKEPYWSLSELFELALFLHQAFSANQAKLDIYILVETEWKRGEATLFSSVSKMSSRIKVAICRSELELLTKAGLLTKATQISQLFPASTYVLRA